MMKIIAWNLAHREESWRFLLGTDADIALVQEAAAPPPDVAQRIAVDSAPWQTAGAASNRQWRTAVVKLSDRVNTEWLEPKAIPDAKSGELAVSRLGTLAAAIVTPSDGKPLVVVSMYALWEKFHAAAQSKQIYADASVHRVISDLTAFVGHTDRHRIIAAGDLNILYGYGEHGSGHWASRYETVFARMAALGLSFVGPQAPNGRFAEPWPDELPQTSKNVPTYYTSHQNPTSATRQLDFVFASNTLREKVRVRALNEPCEWGPSDHCRVSITVT
jgi:endonuclease/exonuclease/phosphatase family metal-dependent hydrolase